MCIILPPVHFSLPMWCRSRQVLPTVDPAEWSEGDGYPLGSASVTGIAGG